MSAPPSRKATDELSPLITRDGDEQDPTMASNEQAPEMKQSPVGPKLTTTTKTPTSAKVAMAPGLKNGKITPVTPVQMLPKADTNVSWGQPAGLPMRENNDENLVIFRRALGINYHSPTSDGCTLEEGRKTAIGIYHAVIREQVLKGRKYTSLNVVLYFSLIAQIIIGAALTALGPNAELYTKVITVLGATNTVLAGLIALMKGQGLPERFRKDQVEFRKIQDWLEETEALLAVGIIGRDRREVGLLVEVAFKKYNAAKASAENNRPESYVRQREDDDDDDNRSGGSGNNVVRIGR
jgi:hypothetical protein